MKTFFNTALILFSVLCSGCVSSHYVFQDAAPVAQRNDAQPSAVPVKSGEFDFVEYEISSAVRYPLVNTMDPRREPRSKDVNSMDDVPASSWYTPRLGTKEISPEELLAGPKKVGPPQAPLTVVKAKRGGNSPGFIVKDSRGQKYLFKFDHSDYPAMESTANLVSSRLFWAFGYNVPEDYLYTFKAEDLSVDPNSGVSKDDVEEILTITAAPDDNGNYRVTASLFLSGKILGSIPQRGIRKGDPNDTIAHEDLRILRALRVFSAWTDHSGIRSDNSMDVYEGEEGQGHTVHYLLDFGETLGVHGAEKGRKWDSYEHFFSYQDTLKSYLRFGFPLKHWEKIKISPDDPRESFETEEFELARWRETTQFMPIRHAQAADDYWAAKVISGVTRAQLEALFKAAAHPDADYVNYAVNALLIRREKIYQHVFTRVSALESKGFSGDTLTLEDRGKILLEDKTSGRYKVELFNRNHKRIEKPFFVESTPESLAVKVTPEMLKKAGGYVRAEITSYPDGHPADRPAEFHIRQAADGSPKLAGVVH